MDTVSEQESEVSQTKLDAEYRQILRIIKPYIQSINNNKYLAQYRVWLEKLSNADDEEKFRRNQYLLELARQIQIKKLVGPFDEIPPLGPLPPLKASNWTVEELEDTKQEEPTKEPEEKPMPSLNKQDFCQQWAENNMKQQAPQLPSPLFSPRLTLSQRISTQHLMPKQINVANISSCCFGQRPEVPNKHLLRSAALVQKRNKRKGVTRISKSPNFREAPSEDYIEPFYQGPFEQVAFAQMHQPDPRTVPPAYMSPRPPIRGGFQGDGRPTPKECLKLNNDVSSIAEESSWCDLSEISDTSIAAMASGDTEPVFKIPPVVGGEDKVKQFENKISTLMEEIKVLKTSNKNSQKEIDQNKSVSVLAANVIEMANAVKANKDPPIKNRLKNCQSMRLHSPRSTSSRGDSTKAVYFLKERLKAVQQENENLNSISKKLTKKIADMEKDRIKDKEQIEKCLTEAHNKEIEALKNKQKENIKNLEDMLKLKLQQAEKEFETKLNGLKVDHEKKVKEVADQHKLTLKEKDEEIDRLGIIIQTQCVRLVNEINNLRRQIEETTNTNNNENPTQDDERVVFLQKCINKMDKLFQKSEKEYQKQIDKLKHELENKEKTVQLQLQTQRAELVAKNNSEKQKELDVTVQALEARYTKMLQLQQTQAMIEKRTDEQVIQDLKQLLHKHDIPYN